MQTISHGLNGYHVNVGQQVFFQQQRLAEEQLSRSREIKRGLGSAEAIRAHGLKQREYFLEAIGGLPAERGELRAQATGRIERERYRVEKIIFESLPKMYVTCNLYIPKGVSGKVPVVLMPSGHALTAKAYGPYQTQAALLAKNGIAAMAMDPVGQGERFNLIDRATGAQIVRWGTEEHTHIGLACELLGQNIARYFVWDLMRALDYIQTRPELDAGRIGCSGVSGGGTQTCQLSLLDDRVAAAAPACYVTERSIYMKHYHAHDAEQNYFGHIPAGFNYADFFVAFAPKPLMLLGVEYDFFPIEGLLATHEELRRIYRTLGAEDQCRLFLDRTTHELSPALRRETVRFFAGVLGGPAEGELDLDEDPPFAEQELCCTRSGQVLIDFPEAPSLAERVAGDIPVRKASDPKEVIAQVRSLVCEGRTETPLYPRVIQNQVDVHEWRIEHVFFTSEPDITLAGTLVRPNTAEGKLPATIVVGPDVNQLAANDQVMARLRDQWTGGGVLLFLDVRGTGAVAPGPSGSCQHVGLGGELRKLAHRYWMLGENLVCLWAYDILRGLEYVRSRPDIDPQRLGIHGCRIMAAPALLAAVADGGLQRALFMGLPASWADQIKSVYYDRSAVNEPTAIHGVLNRFDTPDLLMTLATTTKVEQN